MNSKPLYKEMQELSLKFNFSDVSSNVISVEKSEVDPCDMVFTVGKLSRDKDGEVVFKILKAR